MTSSLSRRRFLKLIAASGGGLAAVQLLGCQPQTVEVEKEVTVVVKEEVVKGVELKDLSFWMWNTYAPAADNVMELSIRRWAQENGVRIAISRDSDSDYRGKMMPALEAGTLPDAMFIGQAEALLMWDSKGIDDITDLFTEIGAAHGGWMTRLPEYTIRDGVAFFLPYSMDTPMVHFRQDIFEEAGLTVPEGQWTWDETRDLCKQAQDYTEEQGAKKIGWGFGIVKQQHDGWCGDIFRNYAADVWDETGQKIILKDQKSKEATDALNFMKGALDLGLFPSDAASWDWSSNNKSYQEEQCLLVINAASIYVWCKANKPELAEVTGLAPKPKAVRDTTDAGLRYTVVLPTVSRDKGLASQLIKALFDKEIYAPWLEQGFVTNVLREYDALPMWTGKRAQFNLAANIGVYPGYPAPYNNAAMSEAGGPNDPVGAMTVRVLVDGWEPQRAIDEADAFAKGVFAKYF
ncbi:MAG: extracellular solute-binding protein [Chloroflexi bacterium]|nr:extracellular solute-binding protein [Chloroflexota bacterium]